jgi:AmmeMemoRadiSam system protein A
MPSRPPAVPSLTAAERAAVLAVARRSLRAHIAGEPRPPIDPASLSPGIRRMAACFVTLKKNGALRGCILDSFRPHESIAENVARNVTLAATADARFHPVRADELPFIAIEVSVLGTAYDVPFDKPDDLLARLRPGVDGVILTTLYGSSTFLPQVWEQIPDPREFLAELCRKQGSPADCWASGAVTRVQLYSAEHFSETDGGVDAGASD